MLSKKRKIDSENRAFNDEWTKQYCFIEIKMEIYPNQCV